MKQLSILFSSISNGIASISKYKFFRYVLYSGLVAVLTFLFIGTLSWFFGGAIGDVLINFIPWIGERDGSFGKWTGRIVSFGLTLIVFKYILLIATGPLMSKVSERIESYYAPHLRQKKLNIAQSINRGIMFSLRSLCLELLLTALVSLLSFIPFLAVISIPLLFLIQSYFAGSGAMDLTLERFYTIRESASFCRQNFLLPTVYGALFLGLFFIPIVGLFISPIFSTACSSYGVLSILKKN